MWLSTNYIVPTIPLHPDCPLRQTSGAWNARTRGYAGGCAPPWGGHPSGLHLSRPSAARPRPAAHRNPYYLKMLILSKQSKQSYILANYRVSRGTLRGHYHEMDIFLKISQHFNQYGTFCLCVDCLHDLSKAFHYRIQLLQLFIAYLKLLTGCRENLQE
jgi:hypothetical protein